MLQFRKIVFSVVALLCLCAAPRLGYAQISPYLGDQAMGQTVDLTVTVDKTLSGLNLGSTYNPETTGRIRLNFTYTNSAGQTVSVVKLPVFCVDLYQPIGNGVYTGFEVNEALVGEFPLSSSNLAIDAQQILALELLFSTSFPSMEAYYSLLSPNTTSWSTSKIAGFQIAIWEISHDTWLNSSGNHEFSLSSGVIRGPSQSNNSKKNAISSANSFLNTMNAALAAEVDPTMRVAVLEHAQYQDLLFPYYEMAPIPEPEVYAVSGAGFLAVLALVRRRLVPKGLKKPIGRVSPRE